MALMGSGEYSGVSGYSGSDRDEAFAPRDIAAERPTSLAAMLQRGMDPTTANEYLDLFAQARDGSISPQGEERIRQITSAHPWMQGDGLNYGTAAGILALGGLAGYLTPATTAAGAGAAGAGTGSIMGTGALGSGFSGAGLGAGTLAPEAIGGLGAMGGGTSALGAGAGAAAAGFAGSAGSPLATGAGALPEWATTTGIGGAGTGMVSGVTGAAAAPPAGSALSRIIDGTASNDDWVQVLGTAGATGLGMYSANQQSNALQDLMNQNRADRAPFLNQATQWANDPMSFAQGPAAQAAMRGTLQGLSATHGNPIGSGTALGIATDAGLRNWLNATNTFGSLGLGGQGIQANLGSQAAQSNADMWTNLGGGISDIVNPRRRLTLADLQGLV